MEKPLAYDECNCFAVRQAARYMTQLYERHLVPVGLTGCAVHAARQALAPSGRMTMAELADSMVMDRTTLVRAMKPLQRDGLIVTGTADAGFARPRVDAVRRWPRTLWRGAGALARSPGRVEKSYGASRAKALRQELFAVSRP